MTAIFTGSIVIGQLTDKKFDSSQLKVIKSLELIPNVAFGSCSCDLSKLSKLFSKLSKRCVDASEGGQC